ncbi:hypothetical protein PO883_20955 [Massilia sp. DJPM01]|nr:hypothetical protein [Massilia sp. DJPM01]MDM5179664.1 hypothetical protein [Massilia sp. DJPM01]
MTFTVSCWSTLRQRLAKYPVADRDDLPGVLGDGNEVDRTDRPARRMLPAHQRFGLADAVVVHVDDGLEMERQLAFVEGPAQLVADRHARLRRLLHAGREVGEAVAAVVLGLVHGLVGVAQQLARALRIARIQGDADAGRDIRQFVSEQEGLGQVVADFLGHIGDRVDVVQFAQGDGEFVAAQARHGIALAHIGLQALADLLEQHVADLVAERVVDFLEMVEVDEQQGQRQPAAVGFFDIHFQPVLEHVAVGQAGQAVDIDFAQGLFDQLAVAHLGRERVGLLLQGGDRALQHVHTGRRIVALGRQHVAVQGAHFVEHGRVGGGRKGVQRIRAQQLEIELALQVVEETLDADGGIVLADGIERAVRGGAQDRHHFAEHAHAPAVLLAGLADDLADGGAEAALVGHAIVHEHGQHVVGLQGQVAAAGIAALRVDQAAREQALVQHVEMAAGGDGNAFVAAFEGVADVVGQALDEKDVVLVELDQVIVHALRADG